MSDKYFNIMFSSMIAIYLLTMAYKIGEINGMRNPEIRIHKAVDTMYVECEKPYCTMTVSPHGTLTLCLPEKEILRRLHKDSLIMSCGHEKSDYIQFQISKTK